MTSTIPKLGKRRARHLKPTKRKKPRFSSMESLGFDYAPMTATNTPRESRPASPPPHAPNGRAAGDDTVVDWEPTEVTSQFLQQRIRWGMVTAVSVVVVALLAGGIWLWQRPEAMAEAAVVDITTQAGVLEPELETLAELNTTLLDSDLDSSAVSTRSLAVDREARALFEASGALPSSLATTRTMAADVASTSLDASRLISDAAAYRSAVLPILSAPELETDPELIGLDDAVRDFGEWQSRFNDVRSALPSNTLSDVSEELTLVAGNLEAIQTHYLDGLRADDRLAAEEALDDLASQLSSAELALTVSLADIQERVAVLLDETLSGINQLAG